jgi:ribosomal protein S18 acetylase RimI-like enzyme
MTCKIHVDEKPWEASFFGYPVHQIRIDNEYTDYESVYNNTKSSLRKYKYSLPTSTYSTVMIDASNVAVANALDDIGFHYLVSVVDMEKTLDRSTPLVDQKNLYNSITTAISSDKSQIKKIAYDSFYYDRWCAEPELDRTIVKKMHEDWAVNCYYRTQADDVLVKTIMDKTVGFIAVSMKDSIARIVLIATDINYRNMGIGSELVKGSCVWGLNRGAKKIIVRTELPNVPAISMYEKEGFRTVKGSIYFGARL